MEEEMSYCAKHKQTYYSWLNRCPICVGEEMTVPKRPRRMPQLINPETETKTEKERDEMKKKEVTKDVLAGVASEFNTLMGLDPQISVDSKKADLEADIKVVVEKVLQPQDKLTAKTREVLEAMGMELPKAPEPEKPGQKKKPEKKKIAGTTFVAHLICDVGPSITKEMILSEIEKEGVKLSESSVTMLMSDVRKVLNYLIETGKLSY